MARIAVVTDSASDLPDEIAGVTVVPLDVRLGESGPEVMGLLTPAEFWQRCAETTALPETSAPSPGAFRDGFLAAADAGYDGVVCVTISSSLSATNQSARAGAAEAADRIPVRVVDSRQATMGEGLVVLAALDAAEAGGDIDTVERAALEAIDRVQTYGTLDSLENLRRGGRIGNAQALLGSLLSIKPVIVLRGGLVEAESRQRTRARSLTYLVDKVREAGPLQRLAVVHAEARDLGTFLDLLNPLWPREQILVSYIGPVIGTHTGAGALGICFERSRGEPGSGAREHSAGAELPPVGS
jgi:DegV family protein with EDD domain